MFCRLLITGFISTVFVAALAGSVLADSFYGFTTLYSPEQRTNLDRPELGKPYRAEARNEPNTGSLTNGRRVPWEQRVPWWREEAIKRGTSAPYDQESTFERSLEAGLAYPEASRKYRRANETDPAVGLNDSRVLYNKDRFDPVIPIVAAAFWDNAKHRPSAQGAFPKPGPTLRYKGVSLVGSGYPNADNDGFFVTAKKAIDMLVELPDSLRNDSRLIDTVIYDPPSASRRAKGGILDFDGVYMIVDVRKRAPLVLYKDMRFSSPLRIAMSLLGGGVMAARHVQLIELMEAGEDAAKNAEREREIKERTALVGAMDPALVNEAECQLQFIFHEADKAFGVSQSKINARLQLIRQRQCR